MSLFQIISLSLLCLFGYKQFTRLKGAPAIKVLYQLRWVFITLLAVLFVSDPTISFTVAQWLGIGRGVDVVIYFALIWLLYQNYNQSQEMEKLYDKLDKLVRELALKGLNERKNNGDNKESKK
jgi:small membrane protein